MLVIKNVSKQIRAKKILNTINLQVEKGSVIFLLGRSGVGKSTLLRIISGLETIDKGEISLDNTVLNKENVHQNVGIVFQHFNLFPHLSVIRNISLVLEKVYKQSKEQAQQKALHLLKMYKLADKTNSTIANLSGGQKQRLAIARTLATQPKVICFDEPSSALDPHLTNYIAEQIKQLAHDEKIIIIATHNINLLLNPYIDGTVYLMHEGSIVESAQTTELKNKTAHAPRIQKFIDGSLHEEN